MDFLDEDDTKKIFISLSRVAQSGSGYCDGYSICQQFVFCVCRNAAEEFDITNAVRQSHAVTLAGSLSTLHRKQQQWAGHP